MTGPEKTRAASIAYLVSQYPAASHTFIRREVEALRRRGIDIRTFSIRRPQDDELLAEHDSREAKATCYVLSASPSAMIAAQFWGFARSPRRYLATLGLALRHRVPGVRALVWSIFHFVEAIVLARELHRADIARLHNHFANSGATVGLLAARYLGLRWSLTLHGISETDYPAGVLLADKIAYAEMVACVSWFGRAQAMRLVDPDQWHKFMIVRCGVERSSFDGLSVALPRPPGSSLNAICVGRLSPEKGQAGLIEAVARLRADGRDVRLTLVGDGPDRATLQAHVRAAGLDTVVSFVGRLDERRTLEAIAASDVLVSSSFMEGLPVVLMEAMALGRPVIAPLVAGVPELVEDGINGLLFIAADWAGFAAALARIADDPIGAAHWGAAGKTRALGPFEIDAAVAPLADFWSLGKISSGST